ncbi:MAG: MFS transporter, partial [Nanoarchaeota archaeon]|nr:MFS transporter [Nanoarchaeota archaeon]
MIHHYPRNIFLHFSFIKNKKILGLFISMALNTFFLSMIGLFVPIYLIKEIGFSFDAAMYYLIMTSLSITISFILLRKIIAKFGLNKIAILSVPVRIIYILMLNGLKSYPIPLTLIAIIGGFGASMYWLPYHKRFAESSDHDKRGSELGVRFALSGFFTIAGPALGGFIATFFGFTMLYSICGIILFLSIIPLFMLKDEHFSKDFKIINILKGRSYKEVLTYFSEGYRLGASSLWPIFIFLILGSYITLGGIFSAVALFESVFQLFAGYLADIINKDNLLKIGTLIDSITWIARIFLSSVYSIFIATTVSGLAISTWYVPFASKYYDKVSETDGVEFILFRELGLTLGKILIYLTAMIFGLKFSLVSCSVVMFMLWLY